MSTDNFDADSFWPWAPEISASDVANLRARLVEMIEQLADLETWPRELRDNVLERAIRAPLSDLLPNLHHFHDHVNQAAAKRDAARAIRGRSWNATGDGLADRGHG